mmetsp:Transcript_24429/g.35900  ORF Transcript_24429/g.35900 Transcript_24429/m.35900 type:complete len:365 (+) Transcript_24429:87-1181(+)
MILKRIYRKITFFFVFSFSVGLYAADPHAVPIIDIHSLLQSDSKPSDWQATMHSIDVALRSYGFFLVTGHDFSKSSIDEAMQAAYTLFDIDIEKKMSVEATGGGFMRGYIGLGKESGLESYYEPKEGYSYGYSWPNRSQCSFGNMLQGHNKWPEGYSSQNEQLLQDVFTYSNKIAEYIVSGISQYFEREFGQSMSLVLDDGDTISIMRLFHYFSTDTAFQGNLVNGKRVIGSSPHTDWGLLTVILQEEDVGGLQVLHEGTWIDIPSVSGSLVVNGGDFLQIASQGRYKSPIHRVLSPVNKERMSFVYFYYPNYYTPFNTQQLCREGNSEEYNTLTVSNCREGDEKRVFGDYILHKWKGVFRDQV